MGARLRLSGARILLWYRRKAAPEHGAAATSQQPNVCSFGTCGNSKFGGRGKRRSTCSHSSSLNVVMVDQDTANNLEVETRGKRTEVKHASRRAHTRRSTASQLLLELLPKG